MASLIEKLSTLQQFLKTLTWKKIAQMAVFFLLTFLIWAAYENRQYIYNFASYEKLSRDIPKTKELSRETMAEIDLNVIKSDLIIGIQIVMVDFQKNTRKVIYTSTDVLEFKILWQKFSDGAIAEIPLFTGDQENNKSIVDLINGNFICLPFADTLGAKLMPDSEKYINTVCATGIPPYYGRFSGVVSIYTKRQPNPEELDQIRFLAKALASVIYEKDFR